MATSFKFHHDSLLTQPVGAGDPITATQGSDDSISPVNKQLWFGSTSSGTSVQATSDPGTDQIVVTPSDGGGVLADTTITLASTLGGLDSATPGAPLSIGATVSGGTGSAVTFWMRIDTGTIAAGAYTDLSLETNDLTES